MAVDTAVKRFSALDPAMPWRASAVLPDGTINAADRRALARFYSGLAGGNAYSLEALFGSFTMTGSDAELSPTTNIDTALERFAAISPGIPWRGINLLPSGSIGRTQRQIIGGYYVPYATGPTYSLTAETGSFVWDGEPSFSDFEIAAQTNSYQMAGSDALLLATRTAFLTSGVFAMTGNDANLTHFTERTLVAVTSAFSMAGSDVQFDRLRSIEGARGLFDMFGRPAVFTWTNANGTPYPAPGVFFGSSGGFADYGSLRERKFKDIRQPRPAVPPKYKKKEPPKLEDAPSDPRLGLPKIPAHAGLEGPDLEAIERRERELKKRKKAELLLL